MSSLVEERSKHQWQPELQCEGFVEANLDTDSGVGDLRTGPGILVLSTNARLLHMNKKAAELLKHMKEDAQDQGAGIPGVITQVCAEIEKLGGAKVDSKAWEEFEIRRTSGPAQRPVLLRGFWMPGAHTDKRGNVLIILEPIGRRQKVAHQGKERFQLTNREQHIVEHLAKGWTNKEIACALGITEPTVKAHMKHIMEKTRCTTRTGVLAQFM